MKNYIVLMNTKLLKLAKMMIQFSEVETSKGILTSIEPLAEGVEVFIADENGEFIAAPDDVYETETQLITVKDGKVEKTEDKEVTPEPADEPVNEEFSKKMQLAEQSYSELMQKIHNAIGGDNYVIDAGDGWAVASVYEDDKETAYRYTYSLDAEGNVILGGRVEVHPRFVTDEEAESLQFADENPDAELQPDDANAESNEAKDVQIKELETKITELEGLLQDRDAVIEELTAKIKELEDKTAVPVEEPVKMKTQVSQYSESDIPALKYFK